MNIKKELQDIMVHSPIPEYMVIKRSLAKDIINELDKKDKVIDMMNQHIYENTYRDLEECEFEEHYQIKCKKNCKECAKEYFYNKAEVL